MKYRSLKKYEHYSQAKHTGSIKLNRILAWKALCSYPNAMTSLEKVHSSLTLGL